MHRCGKDAFSHVYIRYIFSRHRIKLELIRAPAYPPKVTQSSPHFFGILFSLQWVYLLGIIRRHYHNYNVYTRPKFLNLSADYKIIYLKHLIVERYEL